MKCPKCGSKDIDPQPSFSYSELGGMECNYIEPVCKNCGHEIDPELYEASPIEKEAEGDE